VSGDPASARSADRVPFLRPVLRGLAALFVAALPSTHAMACGVCIEDKVAATYDHGVVTRARARHHVVVYAALDGPVDARHASKAAAAAAARARGVDAATVRTAESPAAISFELDPKAQAPEPVLQAVERSAGVPGLRVTLLRIVQ